MKEITVQQAKKQYGKKDVIFLDVRNKDELSVKIKGAINIPLAELEQELKKIPKQKTVIINCRTGIRSRQACKILDDFGVKNTYVLKGGIAAWQKQELPVELGGKRLPIMRQVQITVGLVFVVTSLLGAPWVYVGTFFGLGLLVAGITGWCGMAKLLEIMPWNK